jgi:hypothetical protein
LIAILHSVCTPSATASTLASERNP